MAKDIRRANKEPFEEREDDSLIICRCEEITKGEIRRAIHDGMHTMNEVKRYLRSGMGLCQGQTCQRQVSSCSIILAGWFGNATIVFIARHIAIEVVLGVLHCIDSVVLPASVVIIGALGVLFIRSHDEHLDGTRLNSGCLSSSTGNGRELQRNTLRCLEGIIGCILLTGCHQQQRT